jgi:glutamate/tyrosine decarboxylase-like PLP-dependent enzyme
VPDAETVGTRGQLYTSRVLFELRRHPLALLPEPEIRAVVALHPQRRTANIFRESFHRLERGWQVAQIDGAKTRRPRVQLRAVGHLLISMRVTKPSCIS